MANIIDGVFDSTDDALTLLKGPHFSRVLLEKFASLMERATSENMSFDDIKAAAEEISPEAAHVVERLRGKPNWFITIIFTLILVALKNCHFEVKTAPIDINQLFYQATHNGEVYLPDSQKPHANPYNVLARPGTGHGSKKKN